ncbi:helix-turn-helix domain-containing protein [Arthrobacter sp. CAN_A1]|uniref:helix-turn-helix domain-containing protein n=1 Tax=Arthrobacter sp. CAN_A1 TaxID=2787717 RepID=UPI002FD5919E
MILQSISDRIPYTNNLTPSIRRALAGHTAFSTRFQPALLALGFHRGTNDPGAELANLSKQEKSTALGLGKGLSNRQIGLEMKLSERTVKNMVSSVLMKLGMERRTQAAVLISTTVKQWEDTAYGSYRFSPFPDRIADVTSALRICTSETSNVPLADGERARNALRLTTALTSALSSVMFQDR